MQKQLGLLIPTLPQRRESFSELLNELTEQVNRNNFRDKVKIIADYDFCEMSVGEKRNYLIKMAMLYNCKYIQYLDDDDKIANIFLERMIPATLTDADVITFDGEYHHNGRHHTDFTILKDTQDRNEDKMLYRRPNHICAVKLDIAMQCEFPLINFGEDSAYAAQINKLIKTEYHIPEKLYFYMFDDKKSMTQGQAT